jgi:heterodisulfide reductase subunit A
VATGVDYYDPREASEYGYARFENVITSFELERLLSASGPSRGVLRRLTDTKLPANVAFIQCVGSRSLKADIPYCSRVCCMNSIKNAFIIKELAPQAEITIFNVDIRAFGKGFEEYYRRSLSHGIHYVKGKPSKITEDKQTRELVLSFEDPATKRNSRMRVDLAVLCSALTPAEGTRELASILGIETDHDGFFREKDPCASPLESTRAGVFLCGCSTAPKDITDSIAEASGAAAKASLLLLRDKVEDKRQKTPAVDHGREPRVGVFVCHCGLNIAGLLPVESIAEYARGLKQVVHAEDVLFACAENTQRRIQDLILEHRLNRVVVAACTPKTHEPVFREALSKVGLNPYLLEMVNIRDQCSWVHQKEPQAALAKARDLVRMGVARARLLEPLDYRELDVDQRVLIVGGGVSGLTAARDLAARGFAVEVVEQEKEPGGRVNRLASVYPSGKPGRGIIQALRRALASLGVTVHTQTTVQKIEGFVGQYDVTLKPGGTRRVGAIVLAIGSELFDPGGKFGYGRFPNVISSMDLEERGERLLQADKNAPPVNNVVFIQCVGSREKEGHTGCSRYCCQAAIKQALALRQRGINVTILHRGVRVYSKGAEEMYRQARGAGVLLLEYDEDSPPEVLGGTRATRVEMEHASSGQRISVPADLVILSVGMIPRAKETELLADLLKVPRGQDRFFLERHPKFGPVETSVEGVFLAGACQFPQDIGDCVAQASAVASKVASLLTAGRISLEPITSYVREAWCRGCGKCASVCEYKAIEILARQDGASVARVNEALCKGCGTCAAVCPTGAIDIHHFTDEQIGEVLEALLTG